VEAAAAAEALAAAAAAVVVPAGAAPEAGVAQVHPQERDVGGGLHPPRPPSMEQSHPHRCTSAQRFNARKAGTMASAAGQEDPARIEPVVKPPS